MFKVQLVVDVKHIVGVDYDDTFALVVKLVIIFTLFNIKRLFNWMSTICSYIVTLKRSRAKYQRV